MRTDQREPRLHPRDRSDTWLAVLAHGAGLLGLTVAGWLAAVAISFVLFVLAGQRRSPYLAAHSSQAALFQLAVFVADVAYLLWLAAGFISLGGEVAGLPEWRFLDALGEPWLTAVQLIWGLTALAFPVFHLLTVAGAVVGAWRTARGRPFWYPLVSAPSRRLVTPRRRPAPRPAAPPAGSDAQADAAPAATTPAGRAGDEPPV